MNRLDQCFEQLAQRGRKALVSYIVCGDPEPSLTLPAMEALVAAGTDVIELGVPFSDPMAEGPIIQRGHERALQHKASLRQSLSVVAQFRQNNQHTPVVLMGYANPIERMGYETLANEAVEAGVDGLLTVDLPPEEAVDSNIIFRNKGLQSIYLLAPTSSEKRIQNVAELAGGFVYYVSLKGVTGAANLDIESVHEKLAQIRHHCQLPICVGFGIKDADSAKAVASVADGVIVGSALVEIMGSGLESEELLAALGAKIKPIRAALDGGAESV